MKRLYALYWSPEGRRIATVMARGEQDAVRQTPYPWGKYRGEVYAVLVKEVS